jgi:deoxyribonuclease V
MSEWQVTPEEAVEIQNQLRHRVRAVNSFGSLAEIKTVAGIDVAYDAQGLGRAAVVVLSFPDLTLVEQAVADYQTDFPYIPGLFSFREMPAALAALARLSAPPDLIMVDGQGYAHPRRFGLACHLGVHLGRPTLGCAKKRLIGQFEPPGPQPGDYAPLVDEGETVGAVLRTAAGIKPVFVSVGHHMDLPTAIEVVGRCTQGYRLPEPTRQADILAAINL